MTGESRSLRIGVVAGVEHKIGASESYGEPFSTKYGSK
jgi:hypothetical protein